MAQTLGEKLREAREERGLSVAEVAEQTRISPHYIESIEHDDYKPLPGGIFNKGFVKSFAKTVGVNEQEAITDYTRQATAADIALVDEQKMYRPEVLTDDNSSRSMVPTIITAVVILGAMTAIILLGLNYLNSPSDPAKPVAANTSSGNQNSNSAVTTSAVDPSAPTMATLKVEIKALNAPVPVSATTDGAKSENTIGAGSSQVYEPKESLTVNYNKWNADKVQMTINGKNIALPSSPLKSADKRIEFTINKDNLAQIWSSGTVSTEVPAATTNPTAPTIDPAASATTPTAARPTPIAKPSVPAATNPTPRPPVTTPAATPRPAATSAPAGNRP